MVASAGIRIHSGGSLVVGGGLWGAAPGVLGVPLVIDGNLVVGYDGSALAAADGLVSLPRRPLLRGIKDLG